MFFSTNVCGTVTLWISIYDEYLLSLFLHHESGQIANECRFAYTSLIVENRY